MPTHNDTADANGQENQRPSRRRKPVACVVVQVSEQPSSVAKPQYAAPWYTDARWWLAAAVLLYCWRQK